MTTELRDLSAIAPRVPNEADVEDPDRETLIQTLDPPDRGKEAYKFLFAVFIVEGFLWGKS